VPVAAGDVIDVEVAHVGRCRVRFG
jgi:hypothetical protein